VAKANSRPRPTMRLGARGALQCEKRSRADLFIGCGPILSLGWFRAMNSKEISFLFCFKYCFKKIISIF
jgi:hypothetical protein